MDRQRAGLDTETLDMVLQTLKTVAERRLDKDTRLRLDEDDEFPLDLVNEMLGPELGLHLLFDFLYDFFFDFSLFSRCRRCLDNVLGARR